MLGELCVVVFGEKKITQNIFEYLNNNKINVRKGDKIHAWQFVFQHLFSTRSINMWLLCCQRLHWLKQHIDTSTLLWFLLFYVMLCFDNMHTVTTISNISFYSFSSSSFQFNPFHFSIPCMSILTMHHQNNNPISFHFFILFSFSTNVTCRWTNNK